MSKSKDDAVSTDVYEYLGRQNRPYSAIDIFNNLHKVHGKTAVVKALDSLAEKGKIRSKIYGKQTVYVADQSRFPDVSETELKAVDVQIQSIKDQLKSAEESYKKLDTELRSLNSSITTKEARERLQDVTNQRQNLQRKITQIKTNDNAVSPEDRTQIMGERTVYVKAWRKRKRMANDILGAILEGYPKSKKELYEEVGIETDEEINIKPPEL